MRPHLRLATASSVFVFDQLLREEALLRANHENWCILVRGSSPAIVMGAFTQPDEVICAEAWLQRPIPIVRRFSGGGTVVVDDDTFFVCWVLNACDIHLHPYPQPIMQWVYEQLKTAIKPLDLQLRENDYCLQHQGSLRKIIGNAQSITRGRFIHHSSILWNYQSELMNLLKIPLRQPSYRDKRSHDDFIFSLRHTPLTCERFQDQLISHLQKQFEVEIVDYNQLDHYLTLEYRKSCTLELPFEQVNT